MSDAARLTEVPASAWGCWARTHVGPCYLADRFAGQCFAFPIVIRERRDEIVLMPGEGRRQRPASMALERRSVGLAPGSASADDKPANAQARCREARVVTADPDGLLTEVTAPFGAAAPVQKLLVPSNLEWGTATATVDWYPAYVEPSYDGLLVRVRLRNTSTRPESFAVDQLGGLSTTGESFAVKDLVAEIDPGSSDVVIRHPAFKGALAISAVAESPVRPYRVDDSYFGPDSNLSARSASGIAVPPGVMTDTAPTTAGLWGLERVDDIQVAPQEEVTIYFAIGSGMDADSARDSARHLLNATGIRGGGSDTMFEQAQHAHDASAWASDNLALKRLMAQSLCNVPFDTYRRIGIPTRAQANDAAPLYDPESAGWIALGWCGLRPDRAAAQINAWYLSNSEPDAPVRGPGAVVPSNLFALWELYQQTTDRGMLETFYPYVVKRYRAFADAGRVGVDGALYGWPSAGKKPVPAADYTAYVIRSARILAVIAERLNQPAADIAAFKQDADRAAAALNTSLYDPATHWFSGGAGTAGPSGIATSSRSILPLICGPQVVPPDRAAALLAAIEPGGAFATPVGVRLYLPGSQSGDHADVRFAENWLLWKAMLDYGATDAAQALADKLIAGYTDCVAGQDGLPSMLQADTNSGAYPWDYSGDACCLLSLWESYHRAGTITAGWETELLGRRYDAGSDTLHVVAKASPGNSGKLLCVMGHGNTDYKVTGEVNATVHSSASGVITLGLGKATGTIQFDIAAAGPVR